MSEISHTEAPPIEPEQLTEAEKTKLAAILKNVETEENFVWLYRAEGPQTPAYTNDTVPGANSEGTWFAEEYTSALNIKEDREANFNEGKSPAERVEFVVYAIAIPQSIKQGMDAEGLNLMPTAPGREYRVSTSDIRKNKTPITSQPDQPPTKLDYLNQFDVYKKAERLNTRLQSAPTP